jgi:hypothetical protein
MSQGDMKNVVVLGASKAGLKIARTLAKLRSHQVIVIDSLERKVWRTPRPFFFPINQVFIKRRFFFFFVSHIQNEVPD